MYPDTKCLGKKEKAQVLTTLHNYCFAKAPSVHKHSNRINTTVHNDFSLGTETAEMESENNTRRSFCFLSMYTVVCVLLNFCNNKNKLLGNAHSLPDLTFICTHKLDLRFHISSPNEGDNVKEKSIHSAPSYSSIQLKQGSFYKVLTHSYPNIPISLKAREKKS